MTVYLVDLENTGEAWVKAAQDCMDCDAIYLFYSVNYGKTSLDSIGPFLDRGITVRCRKCTAGKNGLDFQLCSELGYLAARQEDARFIILSNDTGYDVLIGYWDRLGVRVGRRPVLVQSRPSKKKKKAKASVVKKEDMLEKPLEHVGPSKTQCRKAYHAKLRPALHAAEVTESELNKLVGMCISSSQLDLSRRMFFLYNSCASTYGQKRGIEIYRAGREMLRDIANNGPFYVQGEEVADEAVLAVEEAK